MRRAAPTQQRFSAVISERAPEAKDLESSQELEKFLKAMGLYEDATGQRKRQVRFLHLMAVLYAHRCNFSRLAQRPPLLVAIEQDVGEMG